jgi:hypothetical protein
MEVSDHLHAPAALTPRKEPSVSNWIGGWMGPGTGLDDVGKKNTWPLPGLELRPLGRPARSSRPLYRQSYHGALVFFFPLALQPN